MPKNRGASQQPHRSFQLAGETKMNVQMDRTNPPFFEPSLRRNRLHKLASQAKLSKELDEKGLSAFFVSKAEQEEHGRTRQRIAALGRSASPKEATSQRSGHTGQRKAESDQSGPQHEGLRQAASYAMLSSGTRCLAQAAKVAIPHPNAKSYFYDRIMNGGAYDPVAKDIKVNTKMKVYTYNQWTEEKLAPEAKEALQQKNLTQVPRFKRRQQRQAAGLGQSSRWSSTTRSKAQEEPSEADDQQDLLQAVTGDPSAQLPAYYRTFKEQKEQWSLGALLRSINERPRRDEDELSDYKDAASKSKKKAGKPGTRTRIPAGGRVTSAKSKGLAPGSQPTSSGQFDSIDEMRIMYQKQQQHLQKMR